MNSIRYAGLRRSCTAAGLGIAMAAGLASAVPAAGSATSSAGGQVDAPVPRLDWTTCEGAKLKDFQCTKADVPTDYDDPQGPTTSIALTRLRATEPEHRIGSLFTNPGGPGGSGVQFVQAMGKQAYTSEVREHFDIIGFDPRAVAGSDPATCYASPEDEAAALKGMAAFPVTPKQERRFIARNVDLAADCVSRSGDRIAHASTANVARDMDLLRQAVGDDELSYVGYSYGTYLGATYARLFPDRVRALVLDGTMDPAAYSGSDGDRRSIGARIGQGAGASETYGEFLRLCREAGPKRCSLAKLGNPRTVAKRTFRRLKDDPVTIELPDGTPFKVTYPAAVDITFQALYEPSSWTGLADTFADLATADDEGSRAKADGRIADLLRDRRGKDYASIGGALASMCVDAEHPLRPRDYPALADRENAKASHFGRYRSWVGVQCERLGVDDTDAYTGPWTQDVDEPVMVIGTRFDPATPYVNTRPYADSFPDGRMLTLEGWGHTVLGKSDCADRKVASYLVDLEARDGATCEPDSLPFAKTPTGGDVRELPTGVPTPLT